MILADLHVHTDASHDGRSSLDELIAAAKARGLDAIAITDHDTCTPLPKCEDITLIPGVEITTTAGHILGLFLARPVDMPSLTASGTPTVKAAVTAIRACGGVAVLAHPFAPQKLPAEELARFPVDLVECCNARAALKRNHANEQAQAFAVQMNKPASGGSDAHCADELGGAVTKIDCDSRSLSQMKQALLSGHSEVVLVKPCRWRHKGLSRLQRDRREKRVRVGTYVYLIYTVLRGLVQR